VTSDRSTTSMPTCAGTRQLSEPARRRFPACRLCVRQHAVTACFCSGWGERARVLMQHPKSNTFVRPYLGLGTNDPGQARWCVGLEDEDLPYAQQHPYLKTVLDTGACVSAQERGGFHSRLRGTASSLRPNCGHREAAFARRGEGFVGAPALPARDLLDRQRRLSATSVRAV